MSNALLTALLYCVTSIITFTCNMITLYRLYIRKQTWKTRATLNSFHVALNKGEINLLFVSLWDFWLDLLMTVHQVKDSRDPLNFLSLYNSLFKTIMFTFVLRDVYNDPLFDSLYLLTPWISDAISLSRPLILLIMSKQLRIALITAVTKNKYFCGSEISNSMVPSISFS